jgi:hypothetical protein
MSNANVTLHVNFSVKGDKLPLCGICRSPQDYLLESYTKKGLFVCRSCAPLRDRDAASLDTPLDWDVPDFNKLEKVHEWKRYPSQKVKENWHLFTDHQKQILSECFSTISENKS